MSRTDELRQECVEVLNNEITDFERNRSCGDVDGDFVTVNYVTAKRIVELLKKLEAPVEAKWHYYLNDEGRARWQCTNCGKIVRRHPKDKKRCSICGAHMREEN